MPTVVYNWAGKTRNLTCIISAQPKPVIRWIRMGFILTTNETYRIYIMDTNSNLQVCKMFQLYIHQNLNDNINFCNKRVQFNNNINNIMFEHTLQNLKTQTRSCELFQHNELSQPERPIWWSDLIHTFKVQSWLQFDRHATDNKRWFQCRTWWVLCRTRVD